MTPQLGGGLKEEGRQPNRGKGEGLLDTRVLN